MNKQKSLDIVFGLEGPLPLTSGAPVHLLVPVASSSNDLHGITYAARIAAAQNGHIHLYHITDVMDLPVFENPFIIRRWLREVRAEAKNRLNFLTSVIEKLGASVFSSESSVGNVSFLLRQKVEDLIPDLIVVGQGSLGGHALRKMTKNGPCPVLLVPKTIQPSTVQFSIHKKRAKIDLLNLLPNEQWSLN